MLLNSTLLALTLSSLSKSPFLATTATVAGMRTSMSGIRASAFASHFISAGYKFGNFAIYKSSFDRFLRSPILVRSVDLPALSDSVAPVTTENFTAQGSTFTRNTTPDVGGAIHVEGTAALKGDIVGCTFKSNSASFGGAVFVSASACSIAINTSLFDSNDAVGGAHVLLSCNDFIFKDTNAMFGTGDTFIELTKATTPKLFENCNFFRNSGTFFVGEVTGLNLRSCCFMNYSDDGALSTAPMFSGTAQITLTQTSLNGETKASETGAANAIKFTPKDPQGAANNCRLIPLPTPTMDVKFSTAAIFIIVSIAFFVLVSIIGILIVVCCASKNKDEELLEDKESSSSSKK